jgi:hypothetical protein
MPSAKETVLERLRRLFRLDPRRKKPEEPPAVDPFSYVTAPKKPRPSNRGAAAVMELPEE